MSTKKSRWRADGSGNVGQHTAEQAGNFLFDLGQAPDNKAEKQIWISEGLDQRTRVIGPKIMSALTFYNVLYHGFGSESARVVGNVIKRLLIGHEGEGRGEAERILTQNLPREIEIETGIA